MAKISIQDQNLRVILFQSAVLFSSPMILVVAVAAHDTSMAAILLSLLPSLHSRPPLAPLAPSIAVNDGFHFPRSEIYCCVAKFNDIDEIFVAHVDVFVVVFL